jgi:glycosyltransferase involved in cell wall biosynthesis
MYPPLSVFIPTYNCSSYITQTIQQTYAFLQQNFEEFELIIVDDNSKDNTSQIASTLQQQYPLLRVLRNDNGPTKRENLGKAMISAKFDLVLYQAKTYPFRYTTS